MYISCRTPPTLKQPNHNHQSHIQQHQMKKYPTTTKLSNVNPTTIVSFILSVDEILPLFVIYFPPTWRRG